MAKNNFPEETNFYLNFNPMFDIDFRRMHKKRTVMNKGFEVFSENKFIKKNNKQEYIVRIRWPEDVIRPNLNLKVWRDLTPDNL